MTGQFHCNIFLLEKEWPTVVSIVNCWSFLWFKDSCSLLTRKAQAWLAGSWCVWGTWVGGLLILQTFTSSLCFHGAYLPCPLPGGVFPSPGPLSCNPCCWCWGDTAIRAYRVGKGLTPDISLLSSSAFELPCPPTSEPFWGSVVWRGFSLGGWVLCGHSLFNFCPSGSIVLISLPIFQCSLMSVCCALLSFSVSPYPFLILPPF